MLIYTCLVQEKHLRVCQPQKDIGTKPFSIINVLLRMEKLTRNKKECAVDSHMTLVLSPVLQPTQTSLLIKYIETI